MKLKDRYLVVAAIISGKNFPTRNGFNLVAEAKFDGEVLSTDPVSHSEIPLFEQELAWELDKKSLHQHKLQRSCLKIQFFAICNLSPVKEFVGYIMLDLRSASSNKVHKFYPLLHGKYNKNRPEICCAIYLDDDGQEVVLEDFNSGGTSIDPSQLKPKLISNSAQEPCYYQLGPDKLCKDGFLLSVIIFEASNLTHLIPTDIPISNTGDNGFYFYYDLFGNNIISEKFTDLVNAKFLTERTSVNILSTLDIMKMYFKHLEYIQIHLCCNQHSLGIAKIPVSTLLNNIDHSFQQPAILESHFNFYNSKALSRQMKPLTWNMDDPSIKISLTLQRVERFGDNTIKDMNRNSETELVSKNPNLEIQNPPKENFNVKKGFEIRERESVEYFTESSHPGEPMHHLCYSIELRSIRNLVRADHTKRIYTRYVYPLFGSAAPIMTHPPIEVRRDQDVLLPQGYCAFEFGGSWKSLEKKLFNNPLVVEVFERDKAKDTDRCLGVVKIPLNKVLSNFSKKSNHKGHACLTFSDVGQIVISSNDRNSQPIGDLVYNLTLEDFGPLKEQPKVKKTEKRSKSSSDSNVKFNDDNGRNNAEYKAALELELWKEAEEISFLAKLKEKENQTMISLAEEWRRRDKEREILIKKKVAEYEDLEKALRTAIINLAQRERQLAAGEIELQRLRKDLESEVERRTTDLREASRRLEQDCQHQNLMLSSHVEHWKSMAQDWQHKYQHLDKEFVQFKTKQSNSPETKLHSEVNQLQSDKLKLEEALESSLKSKAHYKKQWVRALNEVARLKQKEDQLSKDQLRRQEMELEKMKMRYKTMEDSNTGGSSHLEMIRQELYKLREDAQVESQKTNEDSDRLEIDMNGMDEATTEHLMRLIEERDLLLKTGLYTSHDQVIIELDKEIRKLMEISSKN